MNSNKILVIGVAIADLTGSSSSVLIREDSNIGKINISSGGVGRNIAENLARIQVPVQLLTAIGNDLFGKQIIENCKAAGIGLTYSLISDLFSTPLFLSIYWKLRRTFSLLATH